MKNDTDTPEIDEVEKHAYEYEDDMTPTVKSDLARQLERERNEARGAIRDILSACEGEGWTLDELRICCAAHCRSVITI